MIRLFVVVDLPETVRNQIACLCFVLPDTNWLAAEQIHLTLRFVGEVDGAIFRDVR